MASMYRKKKKKSSKSSKEKMDRALREEQSKLKQVYQDVEKTEAERKFEEIKRQRVSFFIHVFSTHR